MVQLPLSPFRALLLGGKSVGPVYTQGVRVLNSISSRGGGRYSIEFFRQANFSLLSHLCIYSTIYLGLYGVMHISFMLRVTIHYDGIYFVVQIVPASPTRSSWKLSPLCYCHCPLLAFFWSAALPSGSTRCPSSSLMFLLGHFSMDHFSPPRFSLLW